jgi:L-malate glycosyltransferase
MSAERPFQAPVAPAQLSPSRQGQPDIVARVRAGLRRRAASWAICQGLRVLVVLQGILLSLSKLVARPPRSPGGTGYDILLTGSFYSDNWIRSHLEPLAASRRCARLRVVTTYPVKSLDNVEAIYPVAWLQRLVGRSPARLLTFIWTAFRTRPHVMGGFHLLLNGLVAAVVARLVGARSVYFSVGGPAEVLGGGVWSENRLFGKLDAPDPVIERRLITSVATFDLVIAMGPRTVEFFRQHGVETTFRVIPGGIDGGRFRPSETPPTIDLIFVGRLVPIKRVDLFLAAVWRAKRVIPDITAAVLGDGPLREPLERLAHSLQLDGNVIFAGHRQDVDVWLKRAKVFVLTSLSEGLALSLMEAMLSGLPAVVPLVGELPELIQDGVNGYLVARPTPEALADRFLALLTDPARLARFGRAARESAGRFETRAVTRLWDQILSSSQPRSRATMVTP